MSRYADYTFDIVLLLGPLYHLMSELLRDKINAMDEESYAQYVRFYYYTCEKPEHLGASNHLLFVAEK